MCGICGELTFDSSVHTAAGVIETMRDRLVHRGPDDCGLYVSGDRRAGLGFRRLRIIDLTPAANQPMPNEDGTVQVVFNGEIYNYRDLRRGLLDRGHQFRSNSDTEVIAHLYEERGPAAVEELDGMFAIAIWDERERRLVLARDRPGKKPLFYHMDGERFVFASEIKALLAHPGVTAEIDVSVVPTFLTYGYVPHPATLYRGIRQLDPASVLTVGIDARVSQRRYWQLPVPDASATASPHAGARVRLEARDRVRQLVIDAVSKRLVSDVPLGAFLSGGIDSTIVVGVMSLLTRAPVRTFTIGFEDAPDYDETADARRVAARFSTEHTEFRVRPSAVNLLDRLIWHHDGPFGDSSAIPTFLVSELTRPHVTVALTGDGGDELFAGYTRFRAAIAAERLPAASAPLLSAALRLLPDAPHERHHVARARRFARFAHLPLLERAARWNSIFQDDLAEILDPDALAGAAPPPVVPLADRSALNRPARSSPLTRLLAANYESYLPDDLLVKTDRCAMANSLEPRAPLLDTALTEYVALLPDALKLQGRRSKVILREAFQDLIPPEIARRRKTGFGVPLDAWFRGELRAFLHDTLLAPSAASRAYFRPGALERLVADHETGRGNHGHKLWTLITFDRWLHLVSHWTRPSRLPKVLPGGTIPAPSR